MILLITLSNFNTLRFKPPSSLEVGIFIILVIGAALLVLLSIKYSAKKHAEDVNSARESNFKYQSSRFDLTADEQNQFRQIAQSSDNGIDAVFDSQIIFEQCVNKYLETLDGQCTSLSDAALTISSIRDKLRFRHIKKGQPVYSTRNLSTGFRVTVANLNLDAVITISNELSFSLRLENPPANLQLQDTVELMFKRKNDGVYRVTVPVISFDNKSVFECRHTIDLERFQNRKDFRLDLLSSVNIIRKVNVTTRSSTIQMTDVSAGGLSFESTEPIGVHEIIEIKSCSKFNLIKNLQFKVIATNPIRSNLSRYHGQFINQSEEQREQIVSQIFLRIRENLQTDP